MMMEEFRVMELEVAALQVLGEVNKCGEWHMAQWMRWLRPQKSVKVFFFPGELRTSSSAGHKSVALEWQEYTKEVRMQGIDKYITMYFASIDVKTALDVARPRVVAEKFERNDSMWLDYRGVAGGGEGPKKL